MFKLVAKIKKNFKGIMNTKYKVGQSINCEIEIRKDKSKRFALNPLEDSEFITQSFEIIGMNKQFNTYKILIDDDIVGWYLSQWHVKYEDIDEKFVGKKFYDIDENYIID